MGNRTPEKVAGNSVAGSTVSFEIVIDDYAEIWVNRELPAVLGQSGGAVVKGWNAPNKIILTHNAQPGQKFQIAVFGFNGPVSKSPMNFIWVKSATLDFYKPGHGSGIEEVDTKIVRKDPALDAIVTPGTKIEKLAGGFMFTEGPLWVRDGGYLLFSDPNNNVIYRWSQKEGVSVYRTHSGYTGMDMGEYGQPGSNGLTLDAQSRLTINEHGRGCVTRLEKMASLRFLPIAIRVSASIAQTTCSIVPMVRSISRTRLWSAKVFRRPTQRAALQRRLLSDQRRIEIGQQGT